MKLFIWGKTDQAVINQYRNCLIFSLTASPWYHLNKYCSHLISHFIAKLNYILQLLFIVVLIDQVSVNLSDCNKNLEDMVIPYLVFQMLLQRYRVHTVAIDIVKNVYKRVVIVSKICIQHVFKYCTAEKGPLK